MDANIENKLKQIIQGQLRYTSDNLAFNMLIKKQQRKYDDDPGCIALCIDEIETFASKYAKIVATDFAKIEAL